MSKLQKAIGRLGRRETSGFGFGAVQRDQPRSMLLGTIVSPDGAAAALEAGADFVLIQAADAIAAVAGVKAAVEAKALAGAFVDRIDGPGADALAEAGCDFVVSPLAGTASVAVDTERMGQVVRIETTISDTMLRSLAPLGLDALFVESMGATTTLEEQLELVRLASFSGAPLMLTVAPETAMPELRVLRDSGTAAVVLPAGSSADQLRSLAATLRTLPASKRAKEREIALVPTLGGRRDEEEDDDDHDH